MNLYIFFAVEDLDQIVNICWIRILSYFDA